MPVVSGVKFNSRLSLYMMLGWNAYGKDLVVRMVNPGESPYSLGKVLSVSNVSIPAFER